MMRFLLLLISLVIDFSSFLHTFLINFNTLDKDETVPHVAVTHALKSGNDWLKLMNLLMQLRKVCNHPYMLPNAEPEDVGVFHKFFLG
jgi:hypothetical protein